MLYYAMIRVRLDEDTYDDAVRMAANVVEGICNDSETDCAEVVDVGETPIEAAEVDPGWNDARIASFDDVEPEEVVAEEVMVEAEIAFGDGYWIGDPEPYTADPAKVAAYREAYGGTKTGRMSTLDPVTDGPPVVMDSQPIFEDVMELRENGPEASAFPIGLYERVMLRVQRQANVLAREAREYREVFGVQPFELGLGELPPPRAPRSCVLCGRNRSSHNGRVSCNHRGNEASIAAGGKRAHCQCVGCF